MMTGRDWIIQPKVSQSTITIKKNENIVSDKSLADLFRNVLIT
jgi:hypothetical protein